MTISAITKAQAGKIAKAGAYAFISAVIAALIAAIVSNPLLFGIFTPIINVLLVTLKQAVTSPQ